MSNKETGLMKKTKKELVEIIIRKDDEEIRLKKEIESLRNDVACKEDTCKKLRKSLEDANRNTEQHQSGMDEITSQKVAAEEAAKKFEKERNVARGWNWFFATLVIIIAALCAIL